MNSLLNGLLRSAISLSLQDRETFIQKTAEFLEQKTPAEGDLSRRLASLAASMLETTGETMLYKQMSQEAVKPLEEKIDRLIKEIDELKNKI